MTSQVSSDRHFEEPVARGTLRQQVSQRILTAVFQGRFHPGERLVVQRLSGIFHVSPTPVREALVELAWLGIVELTPNRGAVVLPFGTQQVREIGQIRRVLESEAARCACGRIDPAELESLRDELARLGSRPTDRRRDRERRALDSRLHSLVAGSCGSARLTAEVNRYLTLFRTLRDVSHQRDAATNYSRTDDVPEHLAILDRLRDGDAEGSAREMERHIVSSTAKIETVMFTPEASPAPNGP